MMGLIPMLEFSEIRGWISGCLRSQMDREDEMAEIDHGAQYA